MLESSLRCEIIEKGWEKIFEFAEPKEEEMEE
jgi:hypothetical protein